MWRQALRNAGTAARRAARVQKAHVGGALATAGRAHASTASNAWKGAVGLGFCATAATLALAPVAFAGSVQERSFIMVKPDGVHRSLVGDIITRFERKGYKLVGLKVLVPSEDLARQHYIEHEGKPFLPGLLKFLSSGAVVAMVWEGKDVIKYGRTMIGATNPLASPPGTIRGDYGIDVGRNLIHGSDSIESAQKEIALWFKPSELADYEKAAKGWVYESAV